MPILKARHENVKVYRPNGTKYVEDRVVTVDHGLEGAIKLGVENCLDKFEQEFGYPVDEEDLIIEVIGATAVVVVQLFEVKQ